MHESKNANQKTIKSVWSKKKLHMYEHSFIYVFIKIRKTEIYSIEYESSDTFVE